MIDYKNLLYEDYKKLLDEIDKYNKHFLYKPGLEEITLRYYIRLNIGSKKLAIETANNKRLTKIIRISNMPPTEIKKDVIYGLSLLDSEEMADYIYYKQFNDTPKKYISEVKKAILEEIDDITEYEYTKYTKYFKQNK
jgi:hypothetical protein